MKPRLSIRGCRSSATRFASAEPKKAGQLRWRFALLRVALPRQPAGSERPRRRTCVCTFHTRVSAFAPNTPRRARRDEVCPHPETIFFFRVTRRAPTALRVPRHQDGVFHRASPRASRPRVSERHHMCTARVLVARGTRCRSLRRATTPCPCRWFFYSFYFLYRRAFTKGATNSKDALNSRTRVRYHARHGVQKGHAHEWTVRRANRVQRDPLRRVAVLH